MCKLEFLYYFKHDKSFNIASHKHNCFELVYYVSGSGCSNINGVCHKYSKNSFTITLPDFEHDEIHSEETEVLFIGFNYDKTILTLYNGIYFDDYSKKILNILEEMKQEMLTKQKYFEMKLDMLVKEIIIEISRLKGEPASNDMALTYIKKYIGENYHRSIELSDLAKLSGYSYHHFRRIFKQKTGVSPMNYIINIRLDNAKNMLVRTRDKITVIAMLCGFSNTSQFCSMFKETCGCSPGSFRKINS